MARVKLPQVVKLIIGMLAKDKKLFDLVEEFFINRFGPIDYRSPVLIFNHTTYYRKEMGHPLKRKFITFQNLIAPQKLPDIKIFTNKIELGLSQTKESPSRRINIDPGYISDSKLVLASTKNYTHRLYLGKGIYGEVTLYWHKGSFCPWEWTYPDYKTRDYIEIFNKVRTDYIQQKRHYEKSH